MSDRLDHAFFGVDPDDPDFDLDVAQRVYLWYRRDPAADLVAKALVLDVFTHEVEVNKAHLQDAVNYWAADRIAKAAPHLQALYLEEIAKGEDGAIPEIANQALGLIVKNLQGPDMRRNPPTARYRTLDGRPDRWARGEAGKFAARDTRASFRNVGQPRTVGRSIDYDRAPLVTNRTANQRGIPRLENVKPEQQQKFRQAWVQLEDMTRGMTQTGAVDQMYLQWSDPSGKQPPEQQRYDQIDPEMLAQRFADGWVLDGVEVDMNPDLSVGGAAFNLVGALGASDETAASLVGGAGRATSGLKDAWNKTGTAAEPNTRTYARLEAGADAASALLPAHASPQLRAGVEVARFAGRYGQDVEDMIGPTAEKTSYRFRGTERAPDPRLQATLDAMRQNTKDPNGRRGDKLARDRFILGAGGDPVPGLNGRPTENSAVRDYLMNKLPAVERAELHREAGRATPSMGILIDESGQIVSESVGFGEDHYLPFTHRGIKQLRGGEYVRTRLYGGPTTEDFYAAILGGARAFTVVSHSGTYSVEFADDFRGGRRFNDKTARMLRTYAGLLDALQAEVVGFEVPEDRMREIRAEARKRAGSNRAIRDRIEQQLVQDELDDPRLSQAARVEVFEQALQKIAAKKRTRDGRTMDVASMLDEHRNNLGHGSNAAQVEDQAQMFDDQLELAAKASPEGERAREWVMSTLAGADGRNTYNRLISTEEKKRLQSSRKMRLDGKGYDQALQAMHEQFPFYLKKPVYIPNPDKATAGENARDHQYVRPGDTRPYKVKIGYHNAPNSAVGENHDSSKRGRRKQSASERYGRTGDVGVTDSKRTGDEDTRALQRSAPAASTNTGSEAKAADSKQDKAKAGTPAEKARRSQAAKDQLIGMLEAKVEAGQLTYGPQWLGTDGKTRTDQVIPPEALSSLLNGPNGNDGLASMQVGTPQQAQTFLTYLRGVVGGLDVDDDLKRVVGRLEAVTVDVPATKRPEAAGSELSSMAARIKGRGRMTDDDRNNLNRIALDVNFGPEYAKGRDVAEYAETWSQLQAEAFEAGIELPGVDSDTDTFYAALDEATEPVMVELSAASDRGDAEGEKAAKDKATLLLKARRLARMWDATLAEQPEEQAAPEPPDAAGAEPGDSDGFARFQEQLSQMTQNPAERQPAAPQPAASGSYTPAATRAPSTMPARAAGTPDAPAEEILAGMDRLFGTSTGVDWPKFNRMKQAADPGQQAVMDQWAKQVEAGKRRFKGEVGKRHRPRLVRL